MIYAAALAGFYLGGYACMFLCMAFDYHEDDVYPLGIGPETYKEYITWAAVISLAWPVLFLLEDD